MMELLVATTNAGKISELKFFLAGLPIRLRDLAEFPDVSEADENGETFKGNAVIKAKHYALQTNLWCLADDSGLEVAALGGAPGIFSARFGGESASYQQKIEKLLDELNKQSVNNRNARFVCSTVICDASGKIKSAAEGICTGTIAVKTAGVNGFGYDPIFIPDGFDKTFGELPAEIKQKISHRAKSSQKIIQYLRAFNERLT